MINKSIKLMKTETTQRVGKNLAALRTSAAMSQSQVAKDLIVCRTAYAKYEQGLCLPDMKTMCHLAELFHVSLDALINRNIHSILESHFLHREFTDEKTTLLSVFDRLSSPSKRLLFHYAAALSDAETKKKQASLPFAPQK